MSAFTSAPDTGVVTLRETMSAKPLVSLIVPVYNEAAAIAANLAVILNAASADDWYELELVAVDDGSADASADQLALAAEADARIRPISFTRNFGKEAAVLAGLREARGEAVIVIDSDLQHPPALIPQMLALWRNGVYVVDAVKASRGKESFSQGLAARAFYGLFQRFANLNLRGHSDFKLLDREVVDMYLALPERRHFFRGIVNWANYPSAQLPFTVAERAGGSTSWSKLKLARYAIDNLTSFSSMPLRCISWIGAATLVLGLVVAVVSLVQKLRGQGMEGFTTVNLLIIIMGGAIMLSLGVIGHYIARLYDEIKGRPVYLVRPVRKPRE
jgi:dolichol-phosphate mannosyltransferase